MDKKSYIQISIAFVIIFIIAIVYFGYFKDSNIKQVNNEIYQKEQKIVKGNDDLITKMSYFSEDIKGNRYEINSLKLFKNLNSDQFWQPILYKLLEKKISEKPSCLYMIKLIKNLRKSKNLQIKVPNQIFIISDNNLSKLHIHFYSEISNIPCKEILDLKLENLHIQNLPLKIYRYILKKNLFQKHYL